MLWFSLIRTWHKVSLAQPLYITSITSLQKAVCSLAHASLTQVFITEADMLVGCGIYSFAKEVFRNEVSSAPHRIRTINNNFLLFPENNGV